MTTKVLAIDDSRTIRNLLRMCIEGAGFDFHSACDGVEGVDVFADVDPDIVITDRGGRRISDQRLMWIV